MGAHFEALDEGVLLVPLDPRNTQVGLNLIFVQVWGGLLKRRETFYSVPFFSPTKCSSRFNSN